MKDTLCPRSFVFYSRDGEGAIRELFVPMARSMSKSIKRFFSCKYMCLPGKGHLTNGLMIVNSSSSGFAIALLYSLTVVSCKSSQYMYHRNRYYKGKAVC